MLVKWLLHGHTAYPEYEVFLSIRRPSSRVKYPITTPFFFRRVASLTQLCQWNCQDSTNQVTHSPSLIVLTFIRFRTGRTGTPRSSNRPNRPTRGVCKTNRRMPIAPCPFLSPLPLLSNFHCILCKPQVRFNWTLSPNSWNWVLFRPTLRGLGSCIRGVADASGSASLPEPSYAFPYLLFPFSCLGTIFVLKYLCLAASTTNS
jgi:hypothetical protein